MLILSNVGTLYDGKSGTKQSLKTSMDVFIESGTIRELKPHEPNLSVGADHTYINCSDYTVTPGLIDCHSHITVDGLSDADMVRMNSQAAILYVEKILHTTLVNGGVTTIRDLGGATHFIKRMVDEGVVIGPRMKIAICMLSTTSGHADFRGTDRCCGDLNKFWPATPGRPSSIVDGPWECRKRVRELVGCGADVIKLCTSPGVASPSDKLENQDFSREEIVAICEEAVARGLKVAAHAHSKSGIKLAIECGVHDIQHISFMDEALAEQAHAKDCAVTPTSWVAAALLEDKELSDVVRHKAEQIAEHHHHAVQHAAKGGLKILAGTDPVLKNMHGRNYMEVVHLIQDGVQPLTAWYGATGLAAAEIGQTDTGTIEAGKRADLLICKGDVINQPELFEQGALVEVLKDGVGYKGIVMHPK